MPNSVTLPGQVALVTGAARGLGYEISRALLDAGAQVVLMGPNRDTIAAAAAALGGIAMPGSVTSEEDVAAVFAAIRERFGRLDILVNNAGIGGPAAPVEEVTRAQWDEVIDINLTGAFLCAKEAVKMMKPVKRGRIVNISSMAGRIGYALRSPYGASKWGMIGFSRALAAELGPHNVCVNAVLPGAVEGDRIDRVIRDRAAAMGVDESAVRHDYVKAAALGRMVRASDISAMVLHLCSEAGENITGQAIEISGGSYL
jgi:NAD(P)-dependent dehydrogenase (short-subunit alcohol dehydrogenase family)